MRFTIGLKYKGKVNHVVVDAEDAFIAALKAFAHRIVGATSGILL